MHGQKATIYGEEYHHFSLLVLIYWGFAVSFLFSRTTVTIGNWIFVISSRNTIEFIRHSIKFPFTKFLRLHQDCLHIHTCPIMCEVTTIFALLRSIMGIFNFFLSSGYLLPLKSTSHLLFLINLPFFTHFFIYWHVTGAPGCT